MSTNAYSPFHCIFTFYSVQRLLFLFAAASSLLLNTGDVVQANRAQEQVLNVGINLGWAKARLDFNGDADPSEAALIREALQRAAAHVQAAATLFGEPYQTKRQREGIDQRIIQKINGYFALSANYSVSHKSAYVNNIWNMYSQSFQTTFMEPVGGEHYYPACDFSILDVGFHFGRAQIAASVTGNRARSYQDGANGMMRNAIQNGLRVAVDGYEYGPQSNVRKACCCFGIQDAWASLPTFQWNSPFALYSNNLAVLQRIILDAGVVPKPCACFNPADRHWRWKRVGTGDCERHDVAQSSGPQPVPSYAQEGHLAICWDGQTYNNIYKPKTAFCTYKKIAPAACSGGKNIGVMYAPISP